MSSVAPEPSVAPLSVKCPCCGVDVPWLATSHWRPFCSRRCRTQDLGAWASESYRIPATEPDPGTEGSDTSGAS